MTKEKKKLSVGIVLCIAGVSIGGIIKVIAGVNYTWLSTYITVLSTVLLISRPSGKLKLIFIPIFLYSVYTISLALFNGTGMWVNTIGIGYQLVYFLQIILICNLDTQYNYDSIVSFGFYILGIVNIVTLFLLLTGNISAGFGILLSGVDSTSPVSRATTAFLGYYGFIFALSYDTKTPRLRIVKIVFLLVSLLVVLMSSRRSVLIACIVTFILFVRNVGGHFGSSISMRRFRYIVGWIVSIVSIVAIGVIINEGVRDTVLYAWNSLLNGIRTYLGLENVDLAASYRYARLSSIPNQYLNESSFVQFVFGRGYNTNWLDIPFLQAFWDLGLIGGIWYFIVQGIIPFKHLMIKQHNRVVQFAQYYAVLRILQNFSNGTPYGTFFPIVLLYALENVYQDKGRQEEVS